MGALVTLRLSNDLWDGARLLTFPARSALPSTLGSHTTASRRVLLCCAAERPLYGTARAATANPALSNPITRTALPRACANAHLHVLPRTI